jgi:hypothetical protein
VRRARTALLWREVSAERPKRKRRAGCQIYYIRTDWTLRPVFATTPAGTVIWTARSPYPLFFTRPAA